MLFHPKHPFPDISITSLSIAIGLIFICEAGASAWHTLLGGNALVILTVSRSSEATILMTLIRYQSKDNCHDNRHIDGFLFGLYSSAIFGVVVVIASLCILGLTGKNPLLAIRFTLPEAQSTRILFLLVGGLISPVAEELFFRAYLYTYLRKYGVITALMISTATFALCHYKGNELPLIQMVGGGLFGLVYEKSRHVITPITVHVLGNMSIFTLNLLSLH